MVCPPLLIGRKPLNVFDLAERERAAVGVGNLQEEFPILGFGGAQWRLRDVDGPMLHFALALDRAALDAQGAAGAILGS